ncbi:SDR family NAD(P)-dependent oxidoreductase [Prauserella endophytica]|uniref:SDR family NAD(P)-dependent oxidoreductase n=1 Tax=Prauserella endophytica TaxID=1592324 RepID=A0ABY2S790_9PSEU|nr:SDR family NAD(P)-dependent oxidoreductase [Prauserella endophytica]
MSASGDATRTRRGRPLRCRGRPAHTPAAAARVSRAGYDGLGGARSGYHDSWPLATQVTAELSEQDWSDPVDVNLCGTFRVRQAAYPLLTAASEPSIANLTCTEGQVALPGRAGYAASAGVGRRRRVPRLPSREDGHRAHAVRGRRSRAGLNGPQGAGTI